MLENQHLFSLLKDKIMRFLFILLFVYSQAQDLDKTSYEAVYKLEYKKNLNLEPYNVEFFSLRGDGVTSIFEGQHKMIIDTMRVNALSRNKGINHSLKPPTNFNSSILKTKQLVQVRDQISVYDYCYDEQMELDWVYLSKKKEINGFKCKAAQVKYGGRTWNVWYTLDIPIQDGPFKFKGLPGLIIKMSDEKLHYIYTFRRIKMLDKVAIASYYSPVGSSCKNVDRDEFLKMRLNAFSSWEGFNNASGITIANDDTAETRSINRKLEQNLNFIELE